MRTRTVVAALMIVPLAGCGAALASTAAHRPAPNGPRRVVVTASYSDREVRHLASRRARVTVRAARLAAIQALEQRLALREAHRREVAAACPAVSPVHFDTPEAAMTFLADAWNRNDKADLCAVTDPGSRYFLLQMHDEAVNLRFRSCDRTGDGTYTCDFAHDYPARLHRSGHGAAEMMVAPATRPGWFVSSYGDCG